MEEVVLSVDAGGTKTEIALINKNKEIVFKKRYGIGSPAVSSHAMSTIRNGIREVYASSKDKYDIKVASLGISAYAIVEKKEEFCKELEKELGFPVFMNSDATMALYSIIQDKYTCGIVALAGTGTAVLGINGDETFLASGWGQLLTEKGSAYACVKEFVCKIINDYEERGTFTPLATKFIKKLKYTDIQQFKPLIYDNSKSEIARHAMFFVKEAEAGNMEAVEWLKYNGKLLAKDILNVRFHLKIEDEFVLGFRGGFAYNSKHVQQGVFEGLNANGIKYRVVEGDEDPIFGAYYMVLRKGFLC